MPVDERLLEMLCCPLTRAPVKALPDERLERLNARIREGEVKYAEGAVVDKELEEGLITSDDLLVYRVDDGIPVMLAEYRIPTDQLNDF